jgi:dipeptidyl aminopeptidase/acylaminoacyl peptidase
MRPSHAARNLFVSAAYLKVVKARYYWTAMAASGENFKYPFVRVKLCLKERIPAMKKIFQPIVCVVLLVAMLGAQDKNQKATTPKNSASTGLPQLIDRELFFGNPEIAAAEISPDGKYVAFLKPWKDTRNIYVKGVDEPFSAARLLTTEAKRPIPGFFWTWDSKYVLYIKDKDGDENYNVYAVDPAAKPDAGAEAPASRDLTGLKGIRVQLFDLPKVDPDIAYIGLNDRDKAWHDLYKLKISTGEKTLVRKNTERITGWQFDLKGNLRLATRSAENGDTEVLRVDPDKFTKIYSCTVFETCGPVRFHKDGKHVYFQTNKGADTNLVSLTLLDPETGNTQIVESDPMKRVDFDGARFSEATDDLVITLYYDEHRRRYYHDKGFESDLKWLESKFPGKEISIASDTRDEQTWLIVANSDTEPGETYLFHRNGRKLALQYKIREKLPREALAEMKPVTYKSSDGREIPA